ncbi:aldehyde dehydrogenase family protein [Kitasatospora sp. NPDC054939]
MTTVARTVSVDPVVAGRVSASLDRTALADVHGAPLADLGQAPRLAAQAALAVLRRQADGLPPDPAVFPRAAELFAGAELDGEDPAEYVRRVSAATGLPEQAVHGAVRVLRAELEGFAPTTAAELPATVLGPAHGVRWVPAGRVFAAVMASNHPAPHFTWVQALYHGYSVLVRPGGRDPFTPRRLTAALLAAGLPAHKLAFLPGPHRIGEFLLEQADRGIVYGGDAAVRRWHDSAKVTTRGPGRTKALLDTDPTDGLIAHLAASAAVDGGVRCNNLSAVLTSRPVAEVADALADRLYAAHADPAQLPVLDAGRAEGLRRQVAGLLAGLTDRSARHHGGDWLEPLPGGAFRARPLVLAADRVGHPAIGTELPFPFLVVAPWGAADGTAPLAGSLVVNLLTDRPAPEAEGLRDAVLREPGVRKVTVGAALPWDAVPGVPHEGNYTGFLLEARGLVVRTGDVSDI